MILIVKLIEWQIIVSIDINDFDHNKINLIQKLYKNCIDR